jgi:hypothetical protein
MAYNDIFRLRIYQRLHGSDIINVLHFVQDDPTPTYGAQQLANDFVTKMRPSMIARAVSQMAFSFVEVQSIVPFSGAPVTAAFPGGTVGSVVGGTVSATLCEVITIYTSRGGRRGRGRMYLAGASTATADVSAGGWLSPQTTRTAAFATALATNYMQEPPVVGWKLGVWSKVIAGPDPPWTTDAFVRATALTVRTIVRTQRRRQVGVGR